VRLQNVSELLSLLRTTFPLFYLAFKYLVVFIPSILSIRCFSEYGDLLTLILYFSLVSGKFATIMDPVRKTRI